MPTPHRTPRPRLPRTLRRAALAVLLCATPGAPPRAADGFTEIGIDAPDALPRVAALASQRPAPEEPPATPAAEDTDWAAWWREWRAWSPFAAPDPPSNVGDAAPDGTRPARLGGAVTPQDPIQSAALHDPWPFFAASFPATTQTVPGTASQLAVPGTPDDAPITLVTEQPLPLFTGSPTQAAAPLIGEPASLALLGSALAALGLLRHRRRR